MFVVGIVPKKLWGGGGGGGGSSPWSPHPLSYITVLSTLCPRKGEAGYVIIGSECENIRGNQIKKIRDILLFIPWLLR